MKPSLPLSGTFALISLVGVAAGCGANPVKTEASVVNGDACERLATPLWSYTTPEGTDAIFTGTTDPDGNLYWIEYQPRLRTQQLVSASRDGSIRYRSAFDFTADYTFEARGAIWVDGLVLTAASDGHIRAFDAPSGELAWDAELSPDRYFYSNHLTDNGSGLVVAPFLGRLHAIDIASGELRWAHPGSNAIAAASGDIFVSAGSFPQTTLTRVAPCGADLWTESVRGALSAVVNDETAVVTYPYRSDFLVQERWWEVPGFDVVVGDDFGLLFGWRDVLHFQLQSFNPADGTLIGEQTIAFGPGSESAGGFFLLEADHVLFAWQETRHCPCLCHPVTFRQARLSAWSKQPQELFTCDLPDLGETALVGVSLHQGSLVIGRRQYLTTACTSQIQPVVIEAYDLPGEELAPRGWVMRAGNPAQSWRPR